jgi:hypothetical protein
MPTLEELQAALKQSWTDDTAVLMSDGHDLFAPNQPAMGQCAVTALIVQDYFGGKILNTTASVPGSSEIFSSHYFNVIDGKTIDLTRVQFKKGTLFSEAKPKRKSYESTREYLLSNDSTKERYDLLKSRVEALLAHALTIHS